MKKSYRFYVASVICLVFFNSTRAETCEGILSLAGRNISDAEKTYIASRQVRDNTCSGESLNINFDLTKFAASAAGVTPPPAGTAVGSVEHAKYFCKNYASQEEVYNRERFFSSTVVESSVKSYVQCRALTQASVFIDAEYGVRVLKINLSRGKDNVEFKGIKMADKTSAECTFKDTRNSPQVTINAQENKSMPYKIGDSQQLVITCVRPERNDPKIGIYVESTEMTIDTDRGGLKILWARDYKYGPSYSSELARELDALKLQSNNNAKLLDAINRRIDTTAMKTGMFSTGRISVNPNFPAISLNFIQEVAQCANPDATAKAFCTGWNPKSRSQATEVSNVPASPCHIRLYVYSCVETPQISSFVSN